MKPFRFVSDEAETSTDIKRRLNLESTIAANKVHLIVLKKTDVTA